MKNSHLIEAVQSVAGQYDEIRILLLFGSQVRGNTRFDSDIDLAIGFKNEPDLMMIGKIVAELESATDHRIDLVVLNGLPSKNPLLAYNITGMHEIVICHDTQLYEAFKTRSYLEYFDFEPILRTQNEKLIEELQHGNFGKIKTA
ncbi:MAG: nucleotidyltransferase domain-containing protein [Sulfuricurvum sp.]|jgi:predicted nucleotidyltransferase|uniref:type VII toxin-antitoxin system MntA family adenylyltransferase antitoxin n=1 Tax=Sulfuricurvum sp. TaxID=2025608 RepID=UPI0025F8E552|nr:nucleotidyltransferase domain-containing protein [Sulfuricurvum sp.]MCK9371762.1 nucleotidyltransferase domain-containing protein [Sulfuricurvum sp.]